MLELLSSFVSARIPLGRFTPVRYSQDIENVGKSKVVPRTGIEWKYSNGILFLPTTV